MRKINIFKLYIFFNKWGKYFFLDYSQIYTVYWTFFVQQSYSPYTPPNNIQKYLKIIYLFYIIKKNIY